MAAEDEQRRLKKIAAAAYDYDRDSRWADYWSNVLVPPHMASRSDVIDHYKRKFYQRYIDPDLVVESMSSTSSYQPSRASARAEPSTASGQMRSRSSGSSTETRTTSAGGNTNPLQLNRQTIQFFINAWVLIMALLGILPIVPRNLANKACWLSLLGTACSSLYSLYILYGKPRSWNLHAIQVWFQSVVATNDFISFVYSLVFVPFQVSFKFAMLPLLCWVLIHDTKFLKRNFSRSPLYRRYFEEICVWIEANATKLSILRSNAEVALGFLLILSLFSWQRNVIQTFIYWHLLKLMYHAPPTAGYHQSAWARVGRTVVPSIQRYAPFLNTPLLAVQKWWFR